MSARFRNHTRHIGTIEPMEPEITAISDRTHIVVSALVFIVFVVGVTLLALGFLPIPQ